MAVTTRHCRCDERKSAERERSFVFDPAARAYVIPEDPLRQMTAKARYLAFSERCDFKHTDHSGEHYKYVDCPFCGGVLPDCQADAPTISDSITEGDGN